MRWTCALHTLAFVVGCGESDAGGTKGEQQLPSSGRIGPSGGHLASADGVLRLQIPAGALAEEVELAIEPLTDTAPHGVGTAYRLSPEGQIFLAPVQLAFAFGPEVTSAGGLGVAFRAAGESWRALPRREIDSASRTVRASTTHFSDWALIEMLKLEPASAQVAAGGTLQLEVLFCIGEANGEEPVDLLPLCITLDDASELGAWEVNGVEGGAPATGTVTASGTRATFTAPATIPARNPVAVSVDVRSGGTQAGKLVSNIEVTEGCPLGVCSLVGTTTTVSVSDDGPNGQFVVTDVAQLRFDYDRTLPGGSEVIYRVSGTLEASWTQTDCTIDLDPASHEVTAADGELTVELHHAEPIFSGSGSLWWVGTQTWTCPPSDPFTVDEIAGYWAVGPGSLETGVLQGRTESDAGGYTEWNFTANP